MFFVCLFIFIGLFVCFFSFSRPILIKHMGVEIQIWRARIGSFMPRHRQHSHSSYRRRRVHRETVGQGYMMISLAIRLVLLTLLVSTMSVETNPGPPSPTTPRKHHVGLAGTSPNPSSPAQKVRIIFVSYISSMMYNA